MQDRTEETSTGKVLLDMAVSLDGFVAGPNDEGVRLFEHSGAGKVERKETATRARTARAAP
jgi:hypothetical protein